MAIQFFQEQTQFKLPHKAKIKRWIKEIAIEEGVKIKELNFIFCNDEYLYQLNVDYLQHNTYTDILTFDNSDKEKTLEGDIFISIERIEENSKTEKVSFLDETLRVVSHGVFHLCGYKDKIQQEKNAMRDKENKAIVKFKSLV